MKKIIALLVASLYFALPVLAEDESHMDNAKEASGEAWEKTKEASGETWEATKEGSEKAWDATTDAPGKGRSSAGTPGVPASPRTVPETPPTSTRLAHTQTR